MTNFSAEYKETFGYILRKYRTNFDLSVEELSKLFKVQPSTFKSIEGNRIAPSHGFVDQLIKMMKPSDVLEREIKYKARCLTPKVIAKHPSEVSYTMGVCSEELAKKYAHLDEQALLKIVKIISPEIVVTNDLGDSQQSYSCRRLSEDDLRVELMIHTQNPSSQVNMEQH